MKKRKTFQLAQKRDRLKNQLVARQQDLDRTISGETVIIPGGGGGGGGAGCAPCESGIIEPCIPPDCEDSFTRTESNGWGTSEIQGISWLNLLGAGVASVDGSSGIYIPQPTVGWATEAEELEAPAPSYPFELELDLIYVQRYPDASIYNFYEGINWFSIDQGTSQLAYDVRVGVALDAKNGDLTLFVQGPAGESDSEVRYLTTAQWESVPLRLRILFDETETKARIWTIANGDPVDWQVAISYTPIDNYRYFKFTGSNYPGDPFDPNQPLPYKGFEMRLDNLNIIRGFCTPAGTAETFTRHSLGSNSWGESELGGTWTHVGNGAWEVDGDFGRQAQTSFDPPPSPPNPRSRLTGLGGRFSLPLEILVEMRWNNIGDYAVFELLTSQLANAFVEFGLFFSSPYYMEMNITSDTDAGVGDFDIDFDPTGGVKFWMRVLIDDDLMWGKLWRDGTTEPSTWWEINVPGLQFSDMVGTLDEIQFSSQGQLGSYFEIDTITFISGFVGTGDCDHAATLTTQRGGETIIGSVDNPGEAVAIGNLHIGICERQTSTIYRLPTNGTRVIAVTVDGLPSRFSFTAPRTIHIPDPVVSDTIVIAKYYSA